MTVRFSGTSLKLVGIGHALPGPAVTNEELLASLERHCDARLAKLAARYAAQLGIRSRHLSRDLGSPSGKPLPGREAPQLCRQALENAGPVAQLSFLLGHTTTPHTLLPPNVAWVAEDLQFDRPYLELRQACTGFASALTVAAAMIAEAPDEQIGIVGSETGSVFSDFSGEFIDREQLVNVVQMGDGAGAAMVRANDGSQRNRISDIYTGHIGNGRQPGIFIDGGGSSDPAGRGPFPHFGHRAANVRKTGEALLYAGIEAMAERGYALADFDWIIPHQVNGHIDRLFRSRFNEYPGRVLVIADTLGNLGSAAIWIGLDRLIRSGQLKRGQRVLALGAEASKYMVGGFVYTH